MVSQASIALWRSIRLMTGLPLGKQRSRFDFQPLSVRGGHVIATTADLSHFRVVKPADTVLRRVSIDKY